MDFGINTAVRFPGYLHRFVDKLHSGAYRNVFKKVFDIRIPESHTAVADPKTDAEIGIGAVNGKKPSHIKSIKPHGIIRAGRNHCGKRLALVGIFLAGGGGGRPGGTVLLALHLGYPSRGSILSQLADADGQHIHVAVMIIVKTHFRRIDDNAFMHGIGQNQLLGNNHISSRKRRIGINPGIGLQHIAEAHLIIRRNRLQRNISPGNLYYLKLAYQPAAVIRNPVGYGMGIQGQSHNAETNNRNKLH